MGLMMKKKSTLANILLVLVFILETAISPVFASTTDVMKHWAFTEISEWMENGLLQGFEDGSFKPDKPMTRAEFITLLNRALGLTVRKAATFTDVSADAWYSEEVEKALAAAYLSGYEDHTFRPDNLITRLEVAEILSSILKLENHEDKSKLNGYLDAASIPQWGIESLNSAVVEKHLQGYPDNTIRPLHPVSRAEAVKVLHQALGTVYLAAGSYGPDEASTVINGNVTVSADGVTIRNTRIEGNLILAAGIGEGSVLLDNVIVTGRTLISGGGMHSILIRNSTLNEVLVDKLFGETPRIVAEGTSVIEALTLWSPARLEENDLSGRGFVLVRTAPSFRGHSVLQFFGDFQVVLDAKADIELLGGTFTMETSAQAAGTIIRVLKEATIRYLVSGAAAQIIGEGSVQKVEVRVAGLWIQQSVDELILIPGISASIAGQVLAESTIFPTEDISPRHDRDEDENPLSNPPQLTADLTENDGVQDVILTFADDPDWRASIEDITVNLVSIAGRYVVAPGCITINADVFSEGSNHMIIAEADHYEDAAVVQTIQRGNLGGMPGAEQGSDEIHYYMDMINLKSVVFKNYLSGEMGFPNCDVNLMQQRGYERWRILNADNPNTTQAVKYQDVVYLQSDWWWGNYLAAQGSEDHAGIRLVRQPQAWIIKDSRDPDSTGTVKRWDTVYFESADLENYVSGQGSGDNATVEMMQTPGAYERWVIEPLEDVPVPVASEVRFGDIVHIKSNKFLTHISSADVVFVDLMQAAGESEQWKIVNPDQPDSTEVVKYLDHVQLQSVHLGKYLSMSAYQDQDSHEWDYQLHLVDQPYQLETWRFLKAADEYVIDPVKPIDEILLESVNWGTYLSGLDSTDHAAVTVEPYPPYESSWSIIPKDYFRNWMSLTPEIVDKPIREIAFPASHDTGTWEFQNEIAPEDENTQLISDALVTADSILTLVDQIAFLSITPEQLQQMKEAAYGVVYDAIKDLAICHDMTIAQQLDAGIRWLDLRMYLAEEGNYTHHFLKGVDMDAELDSIKSFIEQTRGEILVLEMNHFVGDTARYNDFADQLRTELGPYAVIKQTDANGVISPFNMTYRELMGDHPASSMVILLMDGPTDVTSDPIFWNYTQLGIDDGTYEYSNKTTSQAMIDDQLAKFDLAKQNDDLFTLWYTLTCDPDDSTKIVGTRMAEEMAAALLPVIDSVIDVMFSEDESAGMVRPDHLLAYAGISDVAWFWDDIIDGAEDAVDGVNNIMEGIENGYNTIQDLIDYLNNHPDIPDAKDILKEAARAALDEILAGILSMNDTGYGSVEDLSKRVNPDLQTTLEQTFQSFTGSQATGNNKITVIYADFFENSLLVETAIRYSRMP